MPEERISAADVSPVFSLRPAVEAIGDWAAFSGRALGWAVRRLPRPGTFIPICYTIGVTSVPVIVVTGMFIGMVLAVQAYGQFRSMGFETQLGRIVNMSVVRELAARARRWRRCRPSRRRDRRDHGRAR